MSGTQTHGRRRSLKERVQAARDEWSGAHDIELGIEDEEVQGELLNDPNPPEFDADCFGCIASESLIRARAVALEKFNKGEGEEAARQYDSYFTFATLLLGFEGFILSDYLKNDPTNPDVFDTHLNWAVATIMWSFIVNVFLAVVTLHLSKTTNAASFEPWQRSFLPLCQWGCRLSVALFTIGINLLVSECNALDDGYKYSIYALTGLFFLWVVGIYGTIAFGPTDRIIDYFVPRNWCGDKCCSFLTGTTPMELDLLEIHAASIQPKVKKDMQIELARIRRWREKKKNRHLDAEEALQGTKEVGLRTLRHMRSPFHEEDALAEDEEEAGNDNGLQDSSTGKEKEKDENAEAFDF